MIQSNFFENKGFDSREIGYVRRFDTYLDTTSNQHLVVFTSRCGDGGVGIQIPYKTRWTTAYKKQMIAKMYGVEEYFAHKSSCSVVTLLTLTGYQDGFASIAHTGKRISREQLFEKLKIGWRHLSNIIQKILPNIEYFWVMEPHKSGYPHIHIALFGYVPKEIQHRLTNLWVEKYNIGSAEHGIDFKVKSVKESITSVRNYLMKYIAKGIGANGRRSWSPEEYLYHAIAWTDHRRYIGMSQSVSRYCTARKLRYRYITRVSTRCNQSIPTPDLPIDKPGLIAAINYYQKSLGPDPPYTELPKWHYTFILSKGTLSLIHHSKTESVEIINRINSYLVQLLEYTDQFIPLPTPQPQIP